MIIIHSCAPAPFGGLERVIQMLAAGQQRAGHEVHVVPVLTDPSTALDHPFVRDLEAAGIRVHPLRIPGRAYREERRQIERIFNRLLPDVFHTHGYRSDVVQASVARQLGLPTITTVHGFTGGDWKVRLYEKLQERAFRTFSGVAAVSHQIVERLVKSGVPHGLVHLVQNGWGGGALIERSEARRRLGLEGEKNVGWIGRLSREKGPDIALEAIARLRDPAVTLTLIGEGPDGAALERRSTELGLGSRVRFAGSVRDAGTLLSGFDALMLSSRTEGTPIVLLEAMAAGVPIVATAVGGVPRMLSFREALLIPTIDPAALADGIARALEDRDGSRSRAAAAKARLDRDFDLSSWVRSYDQLYLSARPSHRLEPVA